MALSSYTDKLIFSWFRWDMKVVVNNANKLSELVNKKKKMQNWLDFYQLKYSRNPARKPSTKTGFLGLWGKTVDAIDFYTSKIETLKKEVINVYNQEYESAAAFWPDVHGRIITALIVSQLLLMGLLSTKEAAQSTPLLITLPMLTIWFHRFCKGRYEPAFVRYPLQEAMMKDTLERAREPNLNLKSFLQIAYIHPVFKEVEESESDPASEESDQEPVLIPTKRQSRMNTPLPSKHSGSMTSLG